MDLEMIVGFWGSMLLFIIIAELLMLPLTGTRTNITTGISQLALRCPTLEMFANRKWIFCAVTLYIIPHHAGAGALMERNKLVGTTKINLPNQVAGECL